MALSSRLAARPGAPRLNYFIDRFADQAAHVGLLALLHELRGRRALVESDFAEIKRRIAARHAELDLLSIPLALMLLVANPSGLTIAALALRVMKLKLPHFWVASSSGV